MLRNEPIVERLGRRSHPVKSGLLAEVVCDINGKAPAAINNGGGILEPKVSQLMHDDTTTAIFRKLENDQKPSRYASLNQAASLFRKDEALLATFEAIANLGHLPVELGPADDDKIKKPSFGRNWGLQTLEARRKSFVNLVATARGNGSLDSVGIGLQPRGRLLVIDVDPPDKDRGRLGETLDHLTELFGGECPDTLRVDGQGGCHLYFEISDNLYNEWIKAGKSKAEISFGGKGRGNKVELFMPVEGSQHQVAVAPSAGKVITNTIDPAPLPEPFERLLIEMFCRQEKKATPAAAFQGKADPSWEPRRKCFDAIWEQNVKAIQAAGVGDRHITMIRRAKTLAGYAVGMGYLDLAEDCCKSLVDAAVANGKPVGEAHRVIEFGWSNGVKEPLIPSDPKYLKIEKDFADRAAKRGEALIPANTTSITDNIGNSDSDRDLEAANIDHILAKMRDRKWLWGDKASNLGWFVERGLHLVEGKEGTGKTRWLMDLCRRWSLDLRWPDGSKTEVDPDAKMLFVASDSHWDQIAETAVSFGIPSRNIIFAGTEDDPYGGTDIDDPQTMILLRRWLTRYKVGMVVIDTLMAASSRPLVDPQEVAQLAKPLRDLSREFGVPVVMVGHLNSQGETWGRSMGRTCDNVIRLESAPNDEQQILIKSVKARWNRFALPVLQGRQSETGWEYSVLGSDEGDTAQVKGRAAAEIAIKTYLGTGGRASWSDLYAEMEGRGHKHGTIDRAIRSLVTAGVVTKWEEVFPSKKKCTFFDLSPEK